LLVETDVGDVENDFEKVFIVRWDSREFIPGAKLISRKLDLVQGSETHGEGLSKSDPRGQRMSSGGGIAFIGDENHAHM
jgi:hypothetical protein